MKSYHQLSWNNGEEAEIWRVEFRIGNYIAIETRQEAEDVVSRWGKELPAPRIPQQHERLSTYHPCELWDTWRVSRHIVSKMIWPMKKTRLIPYKKHRVLPTNMHPWRNAFSYQRSCLLLNPSGDQCSHTMFTGLLMNWVTLRMSCCPLSEWVVASLSISTIYRKYWSRLTRMTPQWAAVSTLTKSLVLSFPQAYVII